MSRLPKALLTLLPAASLLAACATGSYYDEHRATAAPPPPPPPLPGSLGVSPGASSSLSGTTVAPPLRTTAPMRMSASEIAATLSNNTVQGVSSNGLPYAIYFAGNGQERFREGSFVDTGTWHVRPEGLFCSTLVRLNGDREQCYAMYRSGDTITFARPDGVAIGSIGVVPGNPNGI